MNVTDLVGILLSGDEAAITKVTADKDFLKLSTHPLSSGAYPIHAVVKKGRHAALKALLQSGVNVNQESEELGNYLGYTAAHYAAALGDVVALQILKDAHADFDHPAADQWRPLHVAAFRGQSEAIEKLLDYGVNINCVNRDGNTPLIFSVNHGSLRDTRLLLKRQASIHPKDTNNDTLLHHAMHYQMTKKLNGEYVLPDSQLDIAVVLVLNGARPDERNSDGNTATFYVEKTLPSLPKVLELLYSSAIKLLCSPTELNYLTLVDAKPDFFEKLQMEPNKAAELCEALQALEVERLAARPAKTRSAEEIMASTPLPSAAGIPKGHPPMPANFVLGSGEDPSNGRCPFLARARQQTSNSNVSSGKDAAEQPHCPFSLYSIRKHQVTVLLMAASFVAGYWFGGSGNR